MYVLFLLSQCAALIDPHAVPSSLDQNVPQYKRDFRRKLIYFREYQRVWRDEGQMLTLPRPLARLSTRAAPYSWPVPRQGAPTLTNIDVLVVRNPCLHPGDCLKLRAVHHPKLSHLVDCLVFSTRGKRAAPSMSSGGDLDAVTARVRGDVAALTARFPVYAA